MDSIIKIYGSIMIVAEYDVIDVAPPPIVLSISLSVLSGLSSSTSLSSSPSLSGYPGGRGGLSQIEGTSWHKASAMFPRRLCTAIDTKRVAFIPQLSLVAFVKQSLYQYK